MPASDPKECLNCSKPFNEGRSDKRFCNDLCRTDFNNKLNAVKNKEFNEIIQILKKNRNIMLNLIRSSNNPRYPKERLVKLGFNFYYFTERLQYGDGVFFACFDIVYTKVNKDTYELSYRIQYHDAGYPENLYEEIMRS